MSIHNLDPMRSETKNGKSSYIVIWVVFSFLMATYWAGCSQKTQNATFTPVAFAITPTTTLVAVCKTQAFTRIGGTSGTVQWSVSDTRVGTIGTDGTFTASCATVTVGNGILGGSTTAAFPGPVTVTATDSLGNKATAAVTVFVPQ